MVILATPPRTTPLPSATIPEPRWSQTAIRPLASPEHDSVSVISVVFFGFFFLPLALPFLAAAVIAFRPPLLLAVHFVAPGPEGGLATGGLACTTSELSNV